MNFVSSFFTALLALLLIASPALTQDTTMTISSDGNVGISTTHPAAKLHVLGSDPTVIVESADFGDRAFFYYSGQNGFVIDSWRPSDFRRLPLLFQPFGGNVGIGTSTPGSRLQVNGSLGAGDINRFSNHMFSTRVAEDNENVDVAVFGSNEGTTGFEAGVYGRNYSPQGYGVFSEGNFGVSGDATFQNRVTVSGNITANGVNTGSGAVKTIRGVIDSDGSILSGSGFSVVHVDVGSYRINFDDSFSDYPSISGTVLNTGFVHMVELGSGHVIVWITNPSTLVNFNSFFTFTAIGSAGGASKNELPVRTVNR